MKSALALTGIYLLPNSRRILLPTLLDPLLGVRFLRLPPDRLGAGAWNVTVRFEGWGSLIEGFRVDDGIDREPTDRIPRLLPHDEEVLNPDSGAVRTEFTLILEL